MYSQSVYPIQRVENNDTVVVMTKQQAVAINKRFLSMDSTIKAINESYKQKHRQYSQASKTIARQDSIVGELNRELKKKPQYKTVSRLDVAMATFFVSFSGLLLYFNL